MSEATGTDAQGGAAATAEVVSLPDEITDADFTSIIEQNRQDRGETPAPVSERPATEPTPATPLGDEAGSETSSAPDTAQEIEQLKGAVKGLAELIVQTQRNKGVDPEVPTSSTMEEGLSALAPNDPQGAKEITRLIQEEVKNIITDQLKPLGEQLGQVQGVVAQGASERLRDQYNMHLDQVLDALNVTEVWERDALKAQVTTEGTQKYGNDFNLKNAAQLLREKNNMRLRSRHIEQNAEADAAEADAVATPPVQTPVSGDTVATTVRSQLRNPKNKSMDFRGGDFNKMLKEFMASGVDAVTGG